MSCFPCFSSGEKKVKKNAAAAANDSAPLTPSPVKHADLIRTVAELPHLAVDFFAAEHPFATQLLHDASPCFKLGFAAVNLAILDAARSHPKLHVVDFDVSSGAQHADLIRTLTEWCPRFASLKINAYTFFMAGLVTAHQVLDLCPQ